MAYEHVWERGHLARTKKRAGSPRSQIVLNTSGDAETTRKIYEVIAKIANVEGVILQPYPHVHA